MKFVTNLRALLIGLWLGAACFFSFAVAPSAFAVLPSREMAGSMVSRTLLIVNLSGLAIALIVLAASFIRRADVKPVWVWLERLLLVLVAAACAVGQFVIGWWLAAIRIQFGGRPVDEIPLEDPLRIQFNALHQYSVWVLVAGMVAALLVFFLLVKKNSAAKATNDKISADFDFQNEFKM